MIYVDIYFKKYGWCRFASFRTTKFHKVLTNAIRYSLRWQLPYRDFKICFDNGNEYNLEELRKKGVIQCLIK